MRKFVFLFCILFGYGLSADAQNLKKYSGDMLGGTVTYTYYEDDASNKEKRHGSFKYVKTESNDISRYSLTITGQYAHGYMDGLWSYTINQVDYPHGNAFITGTTKAQMSFKDGMPNGPWTYSSNNKGRLKQYSLMGWSWGPYEALKPETANVTFKNGVLVGSMNVKAAENITGRLNDQGFWIGNWVVNNGNSRSEYTLTNDGLMIKGVGRYNGRIESSSESDAELVKLFQEFKTIQDAEQRDQFCREHLIKIDTTQCKYPTLFDRDFGFIYQYVSEDKTYRDEEGHIVDRKNYGRYMRISRIEPIAFDKFISPYTAHDYSQEDHPRVFKGNVEQFKDAVVRDGWQLNKDAYAKVRHIITQWELRDSIIADLRTTLADVNTRYIIDSIRPLRSDLTTVLRDFKNRFDDRYLTVLKELQPMVLQVESEEKEPSVKYYLYFKNHFDNRVDYKIVRSIADEWMHTYHIQYAPTIQALNHVCIKSLDINEKLTLVDKEKKIADKEAMSGSNFVFEKYVEAKRYLFDNMNNTMDVAVLEENIDRLNRMCDNLLDTKRRNEIRKLLRKSKTAPIEQQVAILTQ